MEDKVKDIEWLYNPNARPAKKLSKHDQFMIKLGWDAAHSYPEPKPVAECQAMVEEAKKQQQVDDTKYYAEKMKEAITRVRIAAKRQERERIIKLPCWLAQSHNEECPIRQALKSS